MDDAIYADKICDILANNLVKYQRKGQCLYTAILFSQALKRKKIVHKFVIGYMNEARSHSYIHCWIEIDGEIFDPSITANAKSSIKPSYTMDTSCVTNIYTIPLQYSYNDLYTIPINFTYISNTHSEPTYSMASYDIEYSKEALYYSLETDDIRYKSFHHIRKKFMRNPRKIWKYCCSNVSYETEAYIKDSLEMLSQL